jgi:hypothetical protein
MDLLCEVRATDVPTLGCPFDSKIPTILPMSKLFPINDYNLDVHYHITEISSKNCHYCSHVPFNFNDVAV